MNTQGYLNYNFCANNSFYQAFHIFLAKKVRANVNRTELYHYFIQWLVTRENRSEPTEHHHMTCRDRTNRNNNRTHETHCCVQWFLTWEDRSQTNRIPPFDAPKREQTSKPPKTLLCAEVRFAGNPQNITTHKKRKKKKKFEPNKITAPCSEYRSSTYKIALHDASKRKIKGSNNRTEHNHCFVQWFVMRENDAQRKDRTK